jgi:hypothetical protein
MSDYERLRVSLHGPVMGEMLAPCANAEQDHSIMLERGRGIREIMPRQTSRKVRIQCPTHIELLFSYKIVCEMGDMT